MATQFLKEIENAADKSPSEMRALVIKWIEKLFPEVQSVGTETLQQWMEEKPEELLILVSASLLLFLSPKQQWYISSFCTIDLFQPLTNNLLHLLRVVNITFLGSHGWSNDRNK